MISLGRFKQASLSEKIITLFREGTFVTDIRYYNYKINLYQLGNEYVEVFFNHKLGVIEKIELLNHHHTRMNFYCAKIRLRL
jgi:hypothetical protein